MEALNLNSLTVDANGQVSTSGLGTGIDFKKLVDDIVAAKRVPIDTIEARVTVNQDKITALESLQSLLTALRQSLDDLRGKVSLANADNIFAAKQVFATTSRLDGVIPSAAANLIGASATNAAAKGSHTLEVRRVATAHKVATKTFTTETTALGFSGTFTITGSKGTATIAVASTDTLADVRDRINTANKGSAATGVSASIVQISATEFVLVLSADETGTNMTITDSLSSTILSDLGISATHGTGTGYRNGLPAADSKIDATNDGFSQITFDGTQGDKPFLVSYDQASKVMKLTRGDGATDTATLASTAIPAGQTETVQFSNFGVTIVLDDKFVKTTDIVVDANTSSITSGDGTIDDSTIKITGSTGDISGIASRTLTFGNLGDEKNITITAGAFTGTFDGSDKGFKTVTLSDGGANSLTIQFDVTDDFDGNETAASIDLQELENLVVSSGTSFSNQLQVGQTARFTADGLLDVDRYESKFITSGSATLKTLTTVGDGAFDIKVGGGIVTVNYDKDDTVSALVGKINAAITAAGGGNGVFDAGTSASLMTDGTGVRLVITDTSGAAITLVDTNNLLAELGVNNELLIERKSNTVNDLFDGITLTLFQAEDGTQVKLDVEQDLTAARTAVEDFVATYNEVKVFLNTHSVIDSTTGLATEDTGVLFGSPTLFGITSRVAAVFGSETKGVGKDFAALAQIGIKFVDNKAVADPLNENTLTIDTTKLDAVLLNNPDDVRRLFTFDFSSSDPRVSLLAFNGKTSFNATGYKLNLNFDDRFHSKSFTEGGVFTQVDAQTAGPAGDGIGKITFDPSLPSGAAYRYSYDSATEVLTLKNLATNTAESVDITTILDAIGNGGDLGAGETANISFTTLKTTIQLSGDNGFTRATAIADGALVTSSLPAAITMTGGSVTTPNNGIDKATVDALRAAGAYSATTGLLTLGITSSGAGEAHFDLAAGMKFRVDGGSIVADITGTDLDDAAAHTVDVYVNNGTSDVMVGTLSFNPLAATASGNGSITIDLGTGLLGETSAVIDKTAPMENYLTFSNGTFEVRDSNSTLLGTVAYAKGESLQTLAANITANVTDVTASVIDAGTTYKLEIVHKDRDTLTFPADTGGLVAQLGIINGGDAVYAANVNGASSGQDDLSATLNGRAITATSLTGADGLKVFYSGGTDLSAVQIDFTVGFGARMFAAIDAMLTPVTGLVVSNIETLKDQNQVKQDRIDDMIARLENTRASLTLRFINMEVALARAKNLQDSIKQSFDALFQSQANR